jgi:hypothetical protein
LNGQTNKKEIMKKSILSLAICLISFNAFAELSIKIPLELANGGTLPNGTIIMGQPAAEPAPEPTDEQKCLNQAPAMNAAFASIGSEFPGAVYNGVSFAKSPIPNMPIPAFCQLTVTLANYVYGSGCGNTANYDSFSSYLDAKLSGTNIKKGVFFSGDCN